MLSLVVMSLSVVSGLVVFIEMFGEKLVFV